MSDVKYSWENRREYAQERAREAIRAIEEMGTEFPPTARLLAMEEIAVRILDVISDAREAELKAQRKW